MRGRHGGLPEGMLLDLPGGKFYTLSLTSQPTNCFPEIRNIIYDYVVDELLICLRHKPMMRVFSSSVQVAIPWATLRRQGLGLTQVCRQIRHEILPLYRHCVWPLITHSGSHAYDYISAVFPDQADAFGTLVLWHHHNEMAGCRVDLKSIMHLATSTRRLDLEFVRGHAPPGHFGDGDKLPLYKVPILDRFLDTRNKAGIERASRMCKRITLDIYESFGYAFCKICMEVRAKYAEPWMTTFASYGVGLSSEPKMVEWLKEIGLQGHMEHFRYDSVTIWAERV